MEKEDLAAEEILPPLPSEDRDFLLNVIDNPPEPNEALRKAARHYADWKNLHRS